MALELVEADGTAVGRVVVMEIFEPDDGQDFSDEDGGNGLEFGQLVGAVGPGNVGFKEISKTHIAEEAGDELSDDTQKREGVEEEFGEEELRIPDREPHLEEILETKD